VKLELANWRLSVLRQDICAAAVEWETNLTANMMSQDRAPLSQAVQAIQCSATSLKQSGTRLNCLTLHAELMVQLITLDCGHVPIPEPFELDRHKITQFQERVSMITLITALWTVAKVALDAAGIEERDSLLVQIRCSMLDTSVSSDDYTSWAHEFMHWMHSLATDQSKPLLVQHTAGTQLSNQLVAAAAPAGPLRRLMRARVIKILKSSPVFGGTGLKQAEQSQLEQCFMVVSGELCQVVEEITSVTAHLHSLYSPMYAPFAAQHPAPQAVWPEAATEITSKLVAVGDADDEEDDEIFDYEQPSVVLQLPGLQPLRYSRSSDRRARSCGSPVSLKRQSSCGEAANAPPVQHVRQRTLGDCQSRSRTTDRGGAV